MINYEMKMTNKDIYIGLQLDSDQPFYAEVAQWCANNNAQIVQARENLYEVQEIPSITPQERQKQFEQDFFQVNLGWVRRKVFMKETGEIKDFLSDLLPNITTAFSLGLSVSAIIYKTPDFTQEIIDGENLQSKDIVWDNLTSQTFINECLMQLQKDFGLG